MARPKLEAGTETIRIQIVAPASFIDRIDEWRSQRRPIPSRAEAIRSLVDLGYEAEKADLIAVEKALFGRS